MTQHPTRPCAVFPHTSVRSAFAKQFQCIYQFIFPYRGFLAEQPAGHATNEIKCFFIAILARIHKSSVK